MKQTLNQIGVVLVLIGFSVFLSIYVVTPYIVTPQIIATDITDSNKAQLIEDELAEILNYPTSNINLQQQLSAAFSKANSTILLKYSIDDEEVSQLAELAVNNKLNADAVHDVFEHLEDTATARFKANSFINYGSWLFDMTFENEARALKEISQIRKNIDLYEIIPKQGFDKYERKSIRYAIAKHAVEGPATYASGLVLFFSYGLAIIGALIMALSHLKTPAGIRNNNIFNHPATSRKWLGVLIGTFLIVFYIVLYFYPEYMVSWVAMVDPLSYWLKGTEAGQFFLYGVLYTLSVLVMGVRMLVKYRNNSYQVVRTLSVMFFQTIFAFLIPEILIRLNQPYFDFKNIWPLDYDFFFDFELNNMIQAGSVGLFMLGWGIALIILAVPIFTYFYGKRWYCSWVCGCGGLAETLGDPFRQLSDKSLKAWKFEKVSIYSVLVFALVMTAGVLYTYFSGSSSLLGINTYSMREVYGAFIGAGFAGVIGTGFYPLMGNRVWCRFGCPLAAYIGLIQRFKSRFRITTNGGQCISCGNCSTYCEMGIDVRSYAQKGQNIVRASCVGCGICAAVCPRGVLKLENKEISGRLEQNSFIK
jgi:Pyruvate/2-oxoacid:ferredoxin oxidoreductase delta subunit